jgi:hypothetical protein
VLRATGFDTPYPPARLEKVVAAGPDRLLDCVERAMGTAVSAVKGVPRPDWAKASRTRPSPAGASQSATMSN